MIRALLLACLLATPCYGFDAPEGTAQCLSCHGADGKSQINFVPIIHGQQTAYLERALRAYRDGERLHGRAPVMTTILDGKTDAELDAFAAYFGGTPSEGLASTLSEITPAAGAETSDRLVYIDEEEGWQRVLAAEHNRDYFLINSFTESEKFLTFCSIASMAAVLNSFKIDRPLDPIRYPYAYFTQENIFTLANQQVSSFEEVVSRGLILENIGKFLTHLDVQADVHFAADTSLDAMRKLIREGLDAQDTRVIVNYDRAVLGQTGSGHVSPIGAYDEETDTALVLDVARYKYPPVWVPMEMLYDAMQSEDSDSGTSRGLVIVERF